MRILQFRHNRNSHGVSRSYLTTTIRTLSRVFAPIVFFKCDYGNKLCIKSHNTRMTVLRALTVKQITQFLYVTCDPNGTILPYQISHWRRFDINFRVSYTTQNLLVVTSTFAAFFSRSLLHLLRVKSHWSKHNKICILLNNRPGYF